MTESRGHGVLIAFAFACGRAFAGDNCTAATFPLDASGVQCKGFDKVAGVTDADGCWAACCARDAADCVVWQWCPSGCWVGASISDCVTPSSAWQGGGRKAVLGPPPAPPQPPHIIFILADDVGWNDVSYHGSPQFSTPNIDALAASGVTLERYYTTATCSPTRACILSGRSIIHHGIFIPYNSIDTASGLNLTYTLLPEHLQAAYGYTTAIVGKWHLGMKTSKYLPSRRGFNDSFVFYQGMLDYWRHFNDMCYNGNTCSALDLHANAKGGQGLDDTDVYGTVGDYSSAMFSRRAAELITKHGYLGIGHGMVIPPFFLYLAFQAGHSSNNKFLQAPDSYFQLDDVKSISPDKTCGQYQTTSDCISSDPLKGAASRKSSAAQIKGLDDGVGDVVAALQRASMWDNALVVFSSDNGGPTDGADDNMNNNSPLRGCKGGYFEGGLRVPAVLAGGKFSGLADCARGAKVYSGLHHAADWLPSLLTLAKRGATGDPTANHALALRPGERPFLDGDGVDNWDFLATGGTQAAGGHGANGVNGGGYYPSARTEIIHAAQAVGSNLFFQSLMVGDLKLLSHPAGTDCGASRAGWYPPPGKAWNYAAATQTIQCGEPPANPDITMVCTAAKPCLFNITDDPCEFHDLSGDPSYASALSLLQARLAKFVLTTVLPYTVFTNTNEPKGDPKNFPPAGDLSTYDGVWRPYLTDADDAALYPTYYSGPGY